MSVSSRYRYAESKVKNLKVKIGLYQIPVTPRTEHSSVMHRDARQSSLVSKSTVSNPSFPKCPGAGIGRSRLLVATARELAEARGVRRVVRARLTLDAALAAFGRQLAEARGGVAIGVVVEWTLEHERRQRAVRETRASSRATMARPRTELRG